MLRLYDAVFSGNGYKVRLALAHLGVDYEYTEVDILKGGSRTAEFLKKNPNGRIPVLELEDGTHLAESNAILFYLASGTELMPEGRVAVARVLQWMFFEQYSHEPYIATSRFLLQHREMTDALRADLDRRRQPGLDALAVLDGHLDGKKFLVGEKLSIADIALYAYTHVADEGGFDLSPYAEVRRWLADLAALPGHVAMNDVLGGAT